MPCAKDGHYHHWPETGELIIEPCERYCQYCTGNDANHEWKFAWFLRRHVRSIHVKSGEKPDLIVSEGWTGNPDGNPRGSPRKKSGKSCEPKTPSPKKTRKSKGSTKTPKTPKAPQTPVSKGKRFRSKLQGSNSKRGDTMDYSSADEEIQRNYFSEAAPVHDIVASIEEEPGFQPMFPNFPAFPAETVIQPGYATNPEMPLGQEEMQDFQLSYQQLELRNSFESATQDLIFQGLDGGLASSHVAQVMMDQAHKLSTGVLQQFF